MADFDDKPDYTDDWMNPPASPVYTHREPQPDDPVEYLIERQKRIITFGDPLYAWGFWSKHATAEERDAELERLRNKHPAWVLRTRDSHPYWDKLRAGC